MPSSIPDKAVEAAQRLRGQVPPEESWPAPDSAGRARRQYRRDLIAVLDAVGQLPKLEESFKRAHAELRGRLKQIEIDLNGEESDHWKVEQTRETVTKALSQHKGEARG